MKYMNKYVTLGIYLLSMGGSSILMAAKSDTLQAAALKPSGRYLVGDEGLELISSAAHFGISFTGKTCEVYVHLSNVGEHNYLQCELDGVYQKRVKVDGAAKAPLVFTASKDGQHTLWIYKATEAHTGAIFIDKVVGTKLKALQEPKKPLIEFIGNSITCGAAADASEVPCGTGQYHDQHNAYKAYGPTLARALGARFVLSSVSGIGIYRNWNSDGPAMPHVYEKADFQELSTRFWNFTTFQPQIISIALGTNDYSKGDGVKPRLPFDSSTFVNNYIKFVQLVKSKQPQAQIVLLSSPMVHAEHVQFENCLTAVKKAIDELYPKDKPVALYFFAPMKARGCSGHPNVEDHQLMAQELVPFFKKLLAQ